VKLHIIRPCAGKGRGRHVYEAAMLEREAPKFTGWPMYIDHETPEQVRANGGLPPSIWKLGGEVLESWWDGSVPAQGRFGQGSVMAWVKPSPWMKPVIEAHPRLVQASVNTHATGVKPRRGSGGVEHVVEGFIDEGSVDWVTRAGAGGGIDTSVLESVMESWLATDEASGDVAEYLRKHQPAVVEALINPPTNAPTNGEEDEPVDPKQLLEAFNALSDDQRREVVEGLLTSESGADTIAEAVDSRLKEVLPVAMEAAATEVERAALAKVDERLDKRESQTTLLEAAKARLDGDKDLADAFREDAWRVISEAEFEPVKPGDDGEGGKSAREVMESVVDAELKRVKTLQEAAGVKPSTTRRRTSVTANGGGGGDDVTVQEHVSRELDEDDDGDHAEHLLQEAGIDYAGAWGLSTPEGEGKGKDNGDGGAE
jgi:hypothetical protein